MKVCRKTRVTLPIFRDEILLPVLCNDTAKLEEMKLADGNSREYWILFGRVETLRSIYKWLDKANKK